MLSLLLKVYEILQVHDPLFAIHSFQSQLALGLFYLI